ncbi:short chain dehydrogenase [Syncephalis pseudoplumigaleata]|uniref:Hydroxysteroid dehydrogenase-like protein 2 n=1 Tax=Syncephalis pseudoplumigaleata TaxID=1712513 RepID=A0A4P9Z599_9FUNG|nr:short chain dehydrogenase [Syncephalis pseudoplumigaleata]|eukprot:RKP27783.1 short chain dehydrogenase [Syncephalis pseudoplumigaleata]
MSLRGKTLLITGASRGIGKAIALRAARDGANVAIAAKTAEPHPKLPGTIYTAAEEVNKAGGRGLPLICDIRSEEQVKSAVAKTVETFGGIDILVNNASAISLTSTEDTPVKRYDLMHSINGRGTWMVSKYCIPHLARASNPHILNISPPLDMKEKWYAPHVAYTMAKINMSLCVLGMAGELRPQGIAVNALWPLTMIETAALSQIEGAANSPGCRHPEIMADAAHAVLAKPSRSFSGNFCIDELVLREEGVTDFDKYSVVPGTKDFQLDFFIDDASYQRLRELGARHSHI